MDELHALDLWDVVMEVLRPTNNIRQQHRATVARQETVRETPKPKQQGIRDVEQLSYVDHVSTNAHSSQGSLSCNF